MTRKVSLVYYNPEVGGSHMGRKYGSFITVDPPSGANIQTDKLEHLQGLFQALADGADSTREALRAVEMLYKAYEEAPDASRKKSALDQHTKYRNAVDQHITKFNRQMALYEHYVKMWAKPQPSPGLGDKEGEDA